MRTFTNILLVIMVFYGVFVLSVNPVFADDSNITDVSYTQQLSGGLHFIGDMLKILDITLYRTDALVNEHQSEYPFLKDMLSGTNQSEASVETMINVSEMDISDANDVRETLAQVHNNLESPADMIEAANKTIGDPDNTTPVIQDMYNTVSNMTDVNNTTSNVTYGYANW